MATLNIVAANAEIERLKSELSAITDTVKSHAEELAVATHEKDSVIVANAFTSGVSAELLEKAQGSLAMAQARIAELELLSASADDKAIDIIARAGFPSPVAVAPEAVTSSNLWEQYHALPNAESKNKFYAANRAAFQKLNQ